MSTIDVTSNDSPELKYRKNDFFYRGFTFPNSETKNRACLDLAFKTHGMIIADITYEMIGMLTWVLTEDGSLWIHDKSHGGGGGFSFESSAK